MQSWPHTGSFDGRGRAGGLGRGEDPGAYEITKVWKIQRGAELGLASKTIRPTFYITDISIQYLLS